MQNSPRFSVTKNNEKKVEPEKNESNKNKSDGNLPLTTQPETNEPNKNDGELTTQPTPTPPSPDAQKPGEKDKTENEAQSFDPSKNILSENTDQEKSKEERFSISKIEVEVGRTRVSSDVGDDESLHSVKQRALYEDDSEESPFVTSIIKKLNNYEGGVTPRKKDSDISSRAPKPKLGTVLGVFFPCVQNIFGVILFIRMVWVVGTAGWISAFIIFFICSSCTMTTSISMSAIATNGVVSGGGVYFMISRALGPEFGGAVGILFYLGTTVASSMYTVGAVEILLQYMAPRLSLFGPLTEPSNAHNSYRVYGSALFFIMFIFVLIGVKFVSKFSPVALICVLISIFCIYIGIFVANPSKGPKLCFVGERLLALDKITDTETGEVDCNKDSNGTLYKMYCNSSTTKDNSDWCQYLTDSQVEHRAGIPGLTSGVFMRNMWSSFATEGSRIGFKAEGDKERGDIITDITTSFVILIGILFPSFTGIMAGSNRSGDLADAQKSIPVGTISAVAVTTFIYFSCMLLFAATVEGQFLRDKFGESMGGGLVVAQLAWPNPWVIMVGAFLSTCGAGLQSLVGAPRLLQAIASDDIIPFLKPFAVLRNGEPVRALLVTAVIAECGVLVANVDYIAPIITMFFLMCYCFTNMACAVQTLLKTPNWRPRFKFYHWSLSLFGVVLCLCLMFMSSWYYALMSIGIAASVYKYIEYKGAEKEWGDGLSGLSMSAARFALLRIEDAPSHVKNWRPQLLILMELDDQLKPKYANLLSFATQLKAGKGLIMIASALVGNCAVDCMKVETAKKNLQEEIKAVKMKGFADVIMSNDLTQCLSYLIQGSGLGSLRHNTVLLGWPGSWKTDNAVCTRFLELIKVINNKHLAALIVKGIDSFPTNRTPKFSGTIDVWWIVHDGGLLMLLPFLLMQHKVWKHCKMRIFTVAEMEDNSIQIKKDIETFLYNLRLTAEVQVVELHSKDISAYTYERTLRMEERSEMWKLLKMQKSTTPPNPQSILDSNHQTQSTTWTGPDKTLETDEPVDNNQYTFSPTAGRQFTKRAQGAQHQSRNVRRMHSAVRLNELIKESTTSACLVILNLPGPPKKGKGGEHYMEFLEVLTEGLDKVLMIRGGGREVITIYS